ncbi:MAG: glycerol dehydrogenase [Tissierellia bacterium]|nr:glycerol dehydrogenase [Tissierellia bacterium]
MRQIQTTPKYLQGPGLLKRIGELVENYGKRVFILTGNTALRENGEDIKKSLKERGIGFHFEVFNGETTYKEVERLKGIIASEESEVVIGLGGGKVMDTAKTAGFKSNCNVIMAPTIACSDAPCSSVSVMYSEEGAVVGVEYFPRNPDIVIVDTEVIAKSPTKFLKAGIGDALSTYFDARISYRNAYPNVFGTEVSTTALGLAKLSYEIILRDGLKAVMSNDMKIVSPELESVVEACTYLSGVGFENCGISCSHSIQDALTEIPECHKFLHGEKVTFGTFCVLVMERVSDDELYEFMGLCASMDLPITLKQLGLVEDVKEKIEKVMDIAYQPGEESVYHMPPYATRDSVYAAILLADKLGTEFLNGNI